MADAHSATPAQIALAWVIHRPAVIAIPGASSLEQLESNVAAAEIELTDREYLTLQETAAQFRPVTGLPAVPRLAPRPLARKLTVAAGCAAMRLAGTRTGARSATVNL